MRRNRDKLRKDFAGSFRYRQNDASRNAADLSAEGKRANKLETTEASPTAAGVDELKARQRVLAVPVGPKNK